MSRLSAFKDSMSTSEESPPGDFDPSSCAGLALVGDILEGVEAVSGVSEAEAGGSVAGIMEVAEAT